MGITVPAYARCQRDLARTYLRLERVEEAQTLVRDAARTFEAQLGIGHPETIETHQLFAEILTRQGKMEEASGIHKRSTQG
jgi:hypothetical protein